MKQRLLYFLKYYLFWVLFFVAQKPLFMLWQHRLLGNMSWVDWSLVPLHGLPLDLSVAAYITVFYGLLLCVSCWTQTGLLRKIANGYTALILAIALLVIVGDNGCFPSWGYHIDCDIFDYLATPKEVLACAPWWLWLIGFVVVDILFALWWWLYQYLKIGRLEDLKIVKSCIISTVTLLVLTALLFLPIRGSVTVSTMNTGRAYYSDNQMLNLAAVNPVFNLVESLSENTFDSKRYRYMPSDEAAQLLHELRPDSGKPAQNILTTEHPHVILVILESFGKCAWEAMPNVQRLASEGIYFSNIYANSFRTDRGLVALLAGFPGSATNSIMTVPSKSLQLPQIGQVLKAAGYDLKFYYGGDEDFTNMRSFLVNGGFEQRVADRDFPLSDRLSKWGVPDHILFEYAAKDIIARQHQLSTLNPQLSTILTLSSHEPFEVPYNEYANPFLNAVAYTDSCLGAFVDTLKASPIWANTLLVLVPDHGYPYPQGVMNYDLARYAIPLVFAGGAIKQPQTVTTLGSQIDWVPTLLHQMRIDAEQFTFAKDLLDTTRTPYAYYHFVDGFTLITPSDTTIIDAVTNLPLNEKMRKCENDKMSKSARAITQRIYESLD